MELLRLNQLRGEHVARLINEVSEVTMDTGVHFKLSDCSDRWCFLVGSPVPTSPAVGCKRIYTGTTGRRLICRNLEIQLEERARLGAQKIHGQGVPMALRSEMGRM